MESSTFQVRAVVVFLGSAAVIMESWAAEGRLSLVMRQDVCYERWGVEKLAVFFDGFLLKQR